MTSNGYFVALFQGYLQRPRFHYPLFWLQQVCAQFNPDLLISERLWDHFDTHTHCTFQGLQLKFSTQFTYQRSLGLLWTSWSVIDFYT